MDILHDVGRSLNPAIDVGQIEGGFLQGVGWLTSEELWWTAEGELKTHAPSTYKIPPHATGLRSRHRACSTRRIEKRRSIAPRPSVNHR